MSAAGDLPAHARRSATSREAAEKIRPHMSRLQRVVWDFIGAAGQQGATLEEISDGTGLALQSVCARRRELDLDGKIRNTGGTRETRSGRRAAVWVLVPMVFR